MPDASITPTAPLIPPASPSPAAGVRGLSPFHQQRLRTRLRRSACSETWVDDQIITLTDTTPQGQECPVTFFDSRVFPPGGRQFTTMRWCRACGRYTPPQAVHLIEHRATRTGPVLSATLQCDDCRISEDDDIHHELYQALPQLRPAGSLSFVLLRSLFGDRKSMK